MAKGLTSGYAPMGATAVARHVEDAFADGPLLHLNTYAGHPVAAEAALATLDVIEGEELVDRAAALEPVLRRELERVRGATPRVVAISVIGLLSSVEIDVADRDNPADLLVALRHEMYEHGLIARAAVGDGSDGRVLPHARGVRGRSRFRGAGPCRGPRRRARRRPMTRIVEVREQSVRLEAAIRNSLIDFSQMTVSVVAVVTDRVVDGRPVVGLGFNSIGRYAQSGLLRDRFIPRLLDADPDTLADDAGELDPVTVRDVLMKNEKPGGHGERSGAVAAVEIAVWDVAAKLAGVPLYRLLADRYNGGRYDTSVEVYAAGGYYYPEDGADRLVTEMRGYLDQGYTHLKMKIGGATLDEDMERLETVLGIVGDGNRLAVDANGRFDLETAIAYGERMEQYGLRWYRRRAIHWITPSRRSWAATTALRSRPPRTCSPIRTSATCSVTPACGPTSTSCRWTPG